MITLFKKRNKKLSIGLLAIIFFLGSLLYWQVGLSQAQTDNGTNVQVSIGSANGGDETAQWLAKVLTWITLGFINLVGKITTIFIEQLMGVVSFNNFIDSQAVKIGWLLVRDLANIFLVVLMLLIALGTLFNIQTYEYKRLLPKLMLAAVLINFSKTIVGLAIDFGQVIMLSFVKAFSGLHGVNGAAAIVNGLGVHSMIQLADVIEGQGGDVLRWNVFGATFLALIMLIIASIVILALTVVLLFRILMLWILIIFSPLAFVASAAGNGPLKNISFVGNYWNNLSKYVAVGPILAFFLWLSFNIMMIKDEQNKQHIIELYRASEHTEGTPGQVEYLASKISSPQNMFDYMVVIALLIGSLMVTQQMAVMAGNFGMKAVNWTKQKSKQIGKWTAKTSGVAADKGFVKLQKKAGVEAPISLRPSKIKTAWQAHAQHKEEALYGREGVVGGMTDKFNAIFGGGRTKRAEQERAAFEIKRMKELVSGDEYDDKNYSISRAKQILESGNLKNPDNQLELKAILERLGKSGDLGDFLEAQGKDSTRQGLKEMTQEIFGKKEGVKIANRLEKITVAKGDLQFLGTTEVDLKTGEAKFTDLEAKDNENKHLQARFENYVAQAKAKPAEERSAVENEFLRVKDEEGGDLTKLSGKAREVMIDEKQAQVVAKAFSNKTPTEQARMLTTNLLAPDGKDKPGLGILGRQVLSVGSEGAIKKPANVRPKTVNFLRNRETFEAIKRLLEDKTLSKEQRENLKEFIKKFKLDGEIDINKEKWEEEVNRLRQEAEVAEQKKDGLAKEGKINTSEYNAVKQEAEAKRQQADQLEWKKVQNEINGLNKEAFQNPQEVAQAGSKLQAVIDEAIKRINEVEVNPNINLDLSKINQDIEEAMKRMQKSIDKNINPNQPKPNLSFISQQVKEQTDIKSQKTFLKQLKSLVSGLSQIVGEKEG